VLAASVVLVVIGPNCSGGDVARPTVALGHAAGGGDVGSVSGGGSPSGQPGSLSPGASSGSQLPGVLPGTPLTQGASPSGSALSSSAVSADSTLASGPSGANPGSGGQGGMLPAGGVAGSVSDLPAEEPVLVFDVDALPSDVPQVGIEISDDDRAKLEADPWHADDVIGTFIDGNGTRYEGIEVNYRGAYQLQVLMSEGSRRNWKVKVGDALKYLGHREWNFNSEYHLRHKMALDLMAFAGVPCPSARHVRFSVNGEDQGVYMQFEDPDNKSWLKDHFGSASGDLFKAAHDLPNEEAYFADLTYLGDNDEDYFLHYNKKLNNNGDAADDFSTLIAFVSGLNDTPDDQMAAWFDRNFDAERFINYLIVANFVSNWDGYPYRPKNYWLYQSPVTTRWVYVPWDLDHTFETTQYSLQPMGPYVGVFYDFDYHEGPENPGEGTERPLVRRLMAIPELRQRYIDRYQELLGGILSVDYLQDRIRALDSQIRPYAGGADVQTLDDATQDMLDFVVTRYDQVRSELDGL
jgi:spore coat protein H